METSLQRQNDEYLKLLVIFHYVVGGLEILFGMFGIFHLLMGLALVFGGPGMFGPPGPHNTPPPTWFGWIFVVSGSLWITLGILMGILTIQAGRCLKRRVKRTFCLVVAGIGCCNMPFGTVLGVFTIIMLMKPEVITQFEGPEMQMQH